MSRRKRPIPRVEKLAPIQKQLPCALTEVELLAYGDALGRTIQEIKAEEDRAVMVKQELKSAMANLEARRSDLAGRITRKSELREVVVLPERDYDANAYREVRQDTGEVIVDRRLTDDEHQLGLAFGEGA